MKEFISHFFFCKSEYYEINKQNYESTARFNLINIIKKLINIIKKQKILRKKRIEWFEQDILTIFGL